VTGRVRGIVLYPHENSEPLRLEFDRDLIVQEFIKTQFAPAEIHVKIVGFPKEITPHFEALAVEDEGEYWDTEGLDVVENQQFSVRSAMNCRPAQTSLDLLDCEAGGSQILRREGNRKPTCDSDNSSW